MNGYAVSFAVTTFAGDPERLWPLLDFAGHCDDLVSALNHIGYQGRVDVDLTARELHDRVFELIGDGAPGARIIHVLSHGELPVSDSLYAVGADGRRTQVAGWIEEVEQEPAHPHTLFLLDLCYAGVPAMAGWFGRRPPDGSRAWVIAACRPDERAYDARFSAASAKVLADLDRLDAYPSRRFIPLDKVAQAIAAEVLLATPPGGTVQHVTGNLHDFVTDIGALELPFFPNPRYDDSDEFAALRATADGVVGGHLDEVLDPAHWRNRSAGYGGATPHARPGCFTGRSRQRRELVRWLDTPAGNPALRVVTGAPGSGKSALLGILVCAAHPQLSQQTTDLWSTVFLSRAPSVNHDLAALHVRRHDLSTVLLSLIRQLDLDLGDRTELGSSAQQAARVRAAIRNRAQQPVIILDALDEASDPQTLLDALLLPLLAARRPDGLPAARLLIGVRHGTLAQPLVDHARGGGGLLDLDEVPIKELRKDLREYVGSLLRLSGRYQDVAHQAARAAFARALAHTLTLPASQEWGAFLVAAVYSHHFISGQNTAITNPAEAALIGRAIPRTLAEVLDLDLGHHQTQPWLRPVLVALAHAQGQGMPLSVLERLAPLWRPNRGGVGSRDMRQALDAARFYLRQVPDRDGTTLYRVFHQGLADHLRDLPGDGPADPAAAVFEALLDPISWPGGRSWVSAVPYLLRHAAEHAPDLDQLTELITDPGLLVHADPQPLSAALRRLDHVAPVTAELQRAVYRTSAHLHRTLGPAARRDILTVDAARWGAGELARDVQSVPVSYDSQPAWWPAWATGSAVSVAHRGTIPGLGSRVNALAVSEEIAFTGDDDGLIRLWDLLDQVAVGDPLVGHHGPVLGLAISELARRPTLISGGADGTIRLWDIQDRVPVGPPIVTYDENSRIRAAIHGLACTIVDGTRIAVASCDDGVARIVDLDAKTVIRKLESGRPGGLREVRAAEVGGVPMAVTTAAEGTVTAWDLTTYAVARELPGGFGGRVRAMATLKLAGTPHTVIATRDEVRLWDLMDGQVTDFPAGDPGVLRGLTAIDLPGNRAVVAGTGDDGVVWAATPGDTPRSLGVHPVGAVAVEATRVAGRSVAVTVDGNATIRLWDLAESGPVGTPVHGHAEAVTAVSVGPDVVTADTSGGIRRWNPVDGAPKTPLLAGHGRPVSGVDGVMIGGRHVTVTAGEDGVLGLWAEDDRDTSWWSSGTSPLTALSCTLVGNRPAAVTGGADGAVRLWFLDDPFVVGTRIGRHTGPVRAVRCVDVNRRPMAVTTGDDGHIQLWDLATASLRGGRMTGHSASVRAVTCANVDTRPIAVTTSDDGTAQAWDLTQLTEIAPLRHLSRSPLRAVCATTIGVRPHLIAAIDGNVVSMYDLTDWIDGARSDSSSLSSFHLPEEVTAMATDDTGRLGVAFGRDVALLRITDPRMAGHG
ncbi:AAA family ATPase [Acrocarpospora catenulata]|uniref:AAA family ATPase n=1 Tax=Acrocarpospora catenulata TaxID=2836182 RepID=UPI001BD94981|nr:AAA family ATPase [Acrocarpospora catenulata]